MFSAHPSGDSFRGISRGMDTLEGPQEGRRAGIAHGQPREATLLVKSDLYVYGVHCAIMANVEKKYRSSNVELLAH